jgi:hypothetical protein
MLLKKKTDATCDSTSQIDDIIDATSIQSISMDFNFILSDAEFDFPNPFSNQKTGLFADPKNYLKKKNQK